MRLIKEEMFAPLHIRPGDKLDVTYHHEGKEIAHIEYPPEPRTVNCMRVYEADEFEGMKDCIIVIIGWKDSPKKAGK